MVCLGPRLPCVSLNISVNSLNGDRFVADSVKEIMNDNCGSKNQEKFQKDLGNLEPRSTEFF